MKPNCKNPDCKKQSVDASMRILRFTTSVSLLRGYQKACALEPSEANRQHLEVFEAQFDEQLEALRNELWAPLEAAALKRTEKTF